MKIFNRFSHVTIVSLALLFTIALTGCKNKATGPEEEEHFPIGALLKMNGKEIVRYEGPSAISGSINIAADNKTDVISIFFLDEDGEEFQPSETGHSLEWSVGDETIAEIGQHSEDGKWDFYILGNSAGTTAISFTLMHEGHEDFTAAGIPITVE